MFSSVPFTGLFAGLKLAGLSSAKCPTESPAKKIAPHKFKLGLSNSSQLASAIFARPSYDRNILFRCYSKIFEYTLRLHLYIHMYNMICVCIYVGGASFV